MIIKEHGIGIALKRAEQTLFVEIAMVGKLTHEDYELFVPMIDNAMKYTPDMKMNMLFDMRELDGWELQAGWDDFKFGLNHRSDFAKLALVGNRKWQEMSAKLSNWFVGGETRYFEDKTEAIQWLYR